ncbi:MAG: protein tyrosine phosphatase [Inquilinus sp.]|nr:protein tyrosine phosphatase [Inquilinus sp.]
MKAGAASFLNRTGGSRLGCRERRGTETNSAMIYVCNLPEMPAHVRNLRPSHLVSLLTAAEQPPTPDGLAADRHHRVEINDIEQPRDGHVLPEARHIVALLGFLHGWQPSAPLLVHCFAGISRSTAAALIALVFRHDGREEEGARRLRQVAPHAQPNRRIIALADDLLGRSGRLIAAREAMGEAAMVPFGSLVRLDPLV